MINEASGGGLQVNMTRDMAFHHVRGLIIIDHGVVMVYTRRASGRTTVGGSKVRKVETEFPLHLHVGSPCWDTGKPWST